MIEYSSIADMAEKRKLWADLSRDMQFDFTSILAKQYSDEAHFILEMLQNAEDIQASKVSITLTKTHMIFRHNAERKFTLKDLNSITSIGASTKKQDVNKIGKFGIGIKSIFAIADQFELHSGGYSVLIHDYVVPTIIESINNDDTYFDLYLKDNHSYQVINQSLKFIDFSVILFLDYLREVVIYDGETLISHLKKTEESGSVVIRDEVSKKEEKYLIYSSSDEKEDKRKVKLAYRVENGIQPIASPKFYCFFATDVRVDLNILLHAPVLTTPARDNINFSEKHNKDMLMKLLEVFEKSLYSLHKIGLLTIDAWKVLPITDTASDVIAAKFHQVLVDFAKKNEVFPTHFGKWATLYQTVQIEDRLYNFIEEGDFTSSPIVRRKPTEVEIFFKNYHVPYVSLTQFLEYNFESSKKHKTDEYLIRMYQVLKEYDILHNARIFKTSSGKFLNKKDCFMPSDEFSLPEFEVDRSLAPYVRNFVSPSWTLGEFAERIVIYAIDGNKSRRNEAVYTQILETYDESYMVMLRLLLKAQSGAGNAANLLEMKMKEAAFLKVENKKDLCSIKNTVLRSEIHGLFPEVCEEYNFLDTEYYRQELTEDEYLRFMKLLTMLGLKNTLILETHEERRRFTISNYSGIADLQGHTLHNLEKALLSQDLEKSTTLLHFLSQHACNLRTIKARLYSNRYVYSEEIPNFFMDVLNRTPCILTARGEWVKPSEVILNAIHPAYSEVSDSSILKYLNFLDIKTLENTALEKITEEFNNNLSKLDGAGVYYYLKQLIDGNFEENLGEASWGSSEEYGSPEEQEIAGIRYIFDFPIKQ